jgi:hypothetical protein
MAHPLQCAARMQTISLEVLSFVTGGAGVSQSWQQIRQQAAPYCPQTVASHPSAPRTRAQAQAVGNACLGEMGSFKAGFARGRINAAIDEAFPR